MWNYNFVIPELVIISIFLIYYFAQPRLPIKINKAFLIILVLDILTITVDVASSVNEGYIRDLQPLLIKGFAQWSTEDEDYAAASESEVREYLSMGMWGFVFPEDELIPIDNNIMTEDGVLFSYKGLNANPTFTIPYEQILPYLTDEALELYQTAF